MATNSLDKNKIKFLLLEGIHSSAVDVIRNAGYTQIETVSGALSDEELKSKIADSFTSAGMSLRFFSSFKNS